MSHSASERYDDVIREYIDFVNSQIGTYMDALAGFAGHHTSVWRQVHRILRPFENRQENGEVVIVHTSYEDPTKPDIIHNRIVRADTYLEENSPGGTNERRQAWGIVIFLYTFWEDEIRPRLAAAQGVSKDEVRSDVMGDCRILRNAILHAQGNLQQAEHCRLKLIGSMFPPDVLITIPCENMHWLFTLIKQDCARLMLERRGVKDFPVLPDQLVDNAIQKGGRL